MDTDIDPSQYSTEEVEVDGDVEGVEDVGDVDSLSNDAYDDEDRPVDVPRPPLSNERKEQLKQQILPIAERYEALSYEIKEGRKAIADLAKVEKELKKQIEQFMMDNSIKKIQTRSGSIQLADKLSKVPLTRDFLKDTLAATFKDEEAVETVVAVAFDGRPTNSSQAIKLLRGNKK